MNPDIILSASFDFRLVALSVFISILAAYAARDLAERLTDARGRIWLAWLVGGAMAHGIGIWSMHYTGMMAFSLPIPIKYDWPTVLLSLLVGMVGSGAALYVRRRSQHRMAPGPGCRRIAGWSWNLGPALHSHVGYAA